MFFLISLGLCLRPAILIPPMLGNQIYVNVSNFEGPWYCPKNLENQAMWVSEEFIVPPLTDCLALYLSSEWDNSENRPVNHTNVEVFPPDWGGLASMKFVDQGIFGLHLAPVFDFIVKALLDAGYVEKQDLFGAPYDWRNAPHNIEYYYEALKDLIETAYHMNNNEKVCLYTYSCGGMVTHYFLTRKVSEEWKEKYIHKVIWASPSIGGSMDAVTASYKHTFQYLPDFMLDDTIEQLFRTVPVLGSHLPNINAFSDEPLVYGPNGEEIRKGEVLDWLVTYGFVREEDRKFFDYGKEIVNLDYEDPNVNSYFVFNAALNTSTAALNFTNGYNETAEIVYGLGDGTMGKDALYYPFNKWKNGNKGKALVLHDFNTTDRMYSHVFTLYIDEYAQYVVDLIKNDDWVVPGVREYYGTDRPKYD